MSRKTNPLMKQAAELESTLIPWQGTCSRYIEARGPNGWLYPEIAILAGRQNGKTWLLKPHIINRLRQGRRILHGAQDRQGVLRDVYLAVADEMVTRYPHELAGPPRFANGQEEIRLKNGGRYRIVAPTRSAARGLAIDDLIFDEVCELTDHDFISAALPTLSASLDPQTIYTSNAGTPDSVVLESLHQRALAGDPTLAWLEWSADSGLAPDDVAGWCDANPSIGHVPSKLGNLERSYRAAQLGNTLGIFEREHLCRTTVARRELLILPDEWAAQTFETVAPSPRPVMGIKMDISGARASAVLAWRLPDGERIALDVVADVQGDPIDADRLGPELLKLTTATRTGEVTFDPYTDADLARHLRRAKALTAREYAAACELFVRLVKARKLVIHDEQGLLADDLAWTTRKSSPTGTYMAVKASDDRPNTAALAAIRATWLASEPFRPQIARIH